jgi:alginate O-acetyltransferase complex protein AlgI
MLFNSISFLLFFPSVFLLYWILPAWVRPWLLLLASCYFYMAFVPQYILILFYLITLDYILGRLIEKSTGKKRHLYFLLSIVSNIGTLMVFKYFNFFEANLSSLASFLHWNYSLQALSLILPLGLSFHIFQSLAYIIEVYRGNYPAEKNLKTYALYVMFFPQLVAGPIERPAQLLPQLHMHHRFDYAKAVSGLRLMAWGFFKKIVIANNLAVLVNFVYARSASADASELLVAVFAFSIQLYADFSGYSDIAVGSARMLGVELIQNFKRPYFSRTTSEFWRRWHISLSSWFRDYVYIPLGGNREGSLKLYRNTLIVFLIMGFWHGAGWHYVVMGFIFGLYICIGRWTKVWRDSLMQNIGFQGSPRAFFQITVTFLLASFAWIFFRAASLTEATNVIYRLGTQWGGGALHFLRCSDYCSFYLLGVSKKMLGLLFISIALLFVVEYMQESGRIPRVWQYRVVRWSGYYVFLLWMLSVGYFAPKVFIYFQF